MQQRTVVLCLFVLASAGCADAPVSPKAVCTTQGLDWAIGKPADEATVFKLRTDSRTGLWRIVTPGQVIRRDQRADRLTIHVDTSNTITGLACE